MTDLSRRRLFGLAAAAAIAPSLPKIAPLPAKAAPSIVEISIPRYGSYLEYGGFPPNHPNCRCVIRPFVSDQLAFGGTGR